jgi:hypothetical protein
MLRGLHKYLGLFNVKAAGLRGENLPIVPTYVVGNSTQQTTLLRVRSVFNGASQVVQG